MLWDWWEDSQRERDKYRRAEWWSPSTGSPGEHCHGLKTINFLWDWRFCLPLLSSLCTPLPTRPNNINLKRQKKRLEDAPAHLFKSINHLQQLQGWRSIFEGWWRPRRGSRGTTLWREEMVEEGVWCPQPKQNTFTGEYFHVRNKCFPSDICLWNDTGLSV